MLKELLIRQEGKTLEFKENTQGLQKIVQTIIAFANTAGGTIVIGIKDKTKEIVGVSNILQDEEKIASAVADSIHPLIFPSFDLHTWQNKDILIIEVPHSYGPFYLKSQGMQKGTYMRLGSTNRIADPETIQEIQKLKNNKYFDELPNTTCPIEQIQFDLARELFKQKSKEFLDSTIKSLNLLVLDQGKSFPSNGAILLFGKSPADFFPSSAIRLGRFLGTTKSTILDQQDFNIPITTALDPIVMFIRRHTSMAGVIGPRERTDIPEYPHIVVREALINALVHTDYAIGHGTITVAIFDDRMEITNPGTLPFGFTLESALTGVSRLRNRVIGRVFRELNLIEQWGSGLRRMIDVCIEHEITPPKFEELGDHFRVTLYPHDVHKQKNLVIKSNRGTQSTRTKHDKDWQPIVIDYVRKHKKISAKQASSLWQVSTRTTTSRLKNMCNQGLLVELSTSPYDPYKSFSLAHNN
ncbi:MAG: ATP-binding protein [Candidatus Babeliales bacterium]|nr:ATP-binding protein [Candidatus Babeliales bacterium]